LLQKPGREWNGGAILQNERPEDDEGLDEAKVSKFENGSIISSVLMPSNVESALETSIPVEVAKLALIDLFRDQQEMIQKGRAAYDHMYNQYYWAYTNVRKAEESET
jgi:hypothetical protein